MHIYIYIYNITLKKIPTWAIYIMDNAFVNDLFSVSLMFELGSQTSNFRLQERLVSNILGRAHSLSPFSCYYTPVTVSVFKFIKDKITFLCTLHMHVYKVYNRMHIYIYIYCHVKRIPMWATYIMDNAFVN